jgi:hypothetical protein
MADTRRPCFCCFCILRGENNRLRDEIAALWEQIGVLSTALAHTQRQQRRNEHFVRRGNYRGRNARRFSRQ